MLFLIFLSIFHIHGNFEKIENSKKNDSLIIENKLLNKILNSRILPAPILTLSPETGLGIGGGLFYALKGKKNERKSGIQFVVLGTTKKQFIIGTSGNLIFEKDKFQLNWNISGRYFFDKYYGIGSFKNPTNLSNYTFRLLSIQASHLSKFKTTPIYIGPQIRVQLLDKIKWEKSLKNMPPGGQGNFTTGLGMRILFDKRNEIINPTNGILFEINGRTHPSFPTIASKEIEESRASGLIPQDSSVNPKYTYLSTEIRKYTPLRKESLNLILANRILIAFSSVGTPFRELPNLGGGNNLRGIYQGSLRDHANFLVENEIRWQLNKLFGINLYTGAGQVANTLKYDLLKNLIVSGGFGFRIIPNPNSSTLLRIDFAKSNIGQFGIYFELNEAF